MNLIEKAIDLFCYGGMPVVMAYHLIMGNIFLNTAAEDAAGLEKLGNLALAPMQYLLAGQKAVLTDDGYKFEQRFDYEESLVIKSAVSILSCPVSFSMGTLLKGLAYLSHETQSRHEKIRRSRESISIKPNTEYYRSIGLAVEEEAAFIDPPQFKRRPQDENQLTLELSLFKEIVQILNSQHIPYWIDCGSLIGLYRYGGTIPWDNDIDISALEPDFDNIVHALNSLDKSKYIVEDWSGRCRPKTYLRVYVKENRGYIDIYFISIDPVRKKLTYIFSNDNSFFATEAWNLYERRFTIPTDFEIIFPLKKGLFEGLEVFAPNNTVKYLQERYGENLAPARLYNEKTGEYEKDLTHPYWVLFYRH